MLTASARGPGKPVRNFLEACSVLVMSHRADNLTIQTSPS